jgi:peptidyl-prolyl cis-trans isomerase A (cyclophilin A)
VLPDWAPLGAARFRALVESGFYDGARFFRVLPGFVAQVGINGDPAVTRKWDKSEIQDDPVRQSNTRGRVTFATGGPNTRTTQIFFNYSDKNARLDSKGFSPFGEVVEGMDVLERLYSGYGEGAPQGKGPDQDRIEKEGNAYLERDFPKLDYIRTARLAP